MSRDAAGGGAQAMKGVPASSRIRGAIRSNALGLAALYVALGGTALALPGENTVDSGDIKDGAVRSVDVRDGALTGTDISDSTLAVPWANLAGMPAGFADGIDNTGSGGGGPATDLSCPAACVQAGEIGKGQVTGSKLALPLTVSGTPASGPLVDVQNGGAGGTRALRGSTAGNGIGVVGTAGGVDGWGVQGIASGSDGVGVRGEATGGGEGVVAISNGLGATAMYAEALGGANVAVRADGSSSYSYGLWASGTDLAGRFDGSVEVNGDLFKSAGSFRIDHPLDPANQYLQHSFVESPDMKNIYDGVVTTDARGLVTVRMPDWFEALNRSFRYQLTVIGRTFARAIVWRELDGGSFVIRTNRPAVKVSWHLTGIRRDAYAKANRIEVEVPKRGEERGRYLYPQGFGKPERKSVAALSPATRQEEKGE